QARRTVGVLAKQHFGIEVAFAGIVDEAVLQPVAAVAGGDSGVMDDWILRGRDVAGRILQYRMRNPQGDRRPVRRRSGDDAVVIIREFLRFLEPLPAARRAAVPVGKSGRVAVESLDDGLGLYGHFVFG